LINDAGLLVVVEVISSSPKSSQLPCSSLLLFAEWDDRLVVSSLVRRSKTPLLGHFFFGGTWPGRCGVLGLFAPFAGVLFTGAY